MGFLGIRRGRRKTEPINVTIKSSTEVLKELNDEISEKLKRFSVFDIDVPTVRLKEFLSLVAKRNLAYRDPELCHGTTTAIVVGRIDANFADHEKGR